jgi:hypothetical protein
MTSHKKDIRPQASFAGVTQEGLRIGALEEVTEHFDF